MRQLTDGSCGSRVTKCDPLSALKGIFAAVSNLQWQCMGDDCPLPCPTHGRRSLGNGGQIPPELGAGGLSPDFVMLQNFKHQITCITM